MGAAARRREHVRLGIAMAASGLIGVTPLLAPAPWVAEGSITQRAANLMSGESLLNVPLNLFQQLVNIPANEFAGMQVLGNSLISSGPWFGASATNIWGEDPGDPLHFMGIIDMLFPFRTISGIGQAAPGVGNDGLPFDPSGALGLQPGDPGYVKPFDPNEAALGHLGLGQQITLWMNAEIPVNASSDADWSAPGIPTYPITGITGIDLGIWFIAMMTGLQKFPLIDNWSQVSLSDLLNGYTFPHITSDNYDPDPVHGTITGPGAGVINPSQGVGVNGEVPDNPIWGTVGTHPLLDADGNPVLNANGNGVNLMPWEGLTWKLDLAYPFQQFWTELQQTPDSMQAYLDGFDLPTLEEMARAVQTLLAGLLIGFDPLVPGSVVCLGQCDIPVWLQLPSLVKGLDALWPGNASIEEWLRLAAIESPVEGGTPAGWGSVNAPTNHQITYTEVLRQLFDFGNPSPANPPSSVDTPISTPISDEMQWLINLMKDLGVQDFVHKVADFLGYEPIYGDDAVAPADASVPWYDTLLGHWGLDGLFGLSA
ncbi:hypothetical protein NM962_19725 [Mycobacterium sp. SVM_VP21]|nr:hypothetical protein NM962_19725 [Mycobacterium sp. SVM_VP21]